MNTQQTARAFVNGRRASSHNSRTDGATYWLHGHAIAKRLPSGNVRFDWCGWHTSTTGRHMQAILREMRSSLTVRYSKAIAEQFEIAPNGSAVSFSNPVSELTQSHT